MITASKVTEVLQDPDIKKLFVEQLAEAQMVGYKAGVVKGIEIVETVTGMDLGDLKAKVNEASLSDEFDARAGIVYRSADTE